MWAKALFEGLFGPKENSTNIIQDIVDEISASGGSDDHLKQAQIIFDRVFGQEVRVLKENLGARLTKKPSEGAAADAETDHEFLSKINVLDFGAFYATAEQQNSL